MEYSVGTENEKSFRAGENLLNCVRVWDGGYTNMLQQRGLWVALMKEMPLKGNTIQPQGDKSVTVANYVQSSVST